MRALAKESAKSCFSGASWSFSIGLSNYVFGDGSHAGYLGGMCVSLLAIAGLLALVAYIKIGVATP